MSIGGGDVFGCAEGEMYLGFIEELDRYSDRASHRGSKVSFGYARRRYIICELKVKDRSPTLPEVI